MAKAHYDRLITTRQALADSLFMEWDDLTIDQVVSIHKRLARYSADIDDHALRIVAIEPEWRRSEECSMASTFIKRECALIDAVRVSYIWYMDIASKFQRASDTAEDPDVAFLLRENAIHLMQRASILLKRS